MEDTTNISTWRTGLAFIFQLIAKLMFVLLVLALPPIIFSVYQDLHGIPISSEVYETYPALYEGFVAFSVLTIGFMSASWYLHYKLIKNIKKEIFWLVALVISAVFAYFLP